MILSALCFVTWGLGRAYAFHDTSPFFYLSTADLFPSPPHIIRSTSLLQTIKEPLSKCVSDAYILVTQPGVNAVDYEARDAVPRLRDLLNQGDGERRTKSSFEVPHVLGELDVEETEAYLHHTCKAEVMNIDASTGGFEIVHDMKPRVVRLDFSALPSMQPQRANQLRDNDAFLQSVLDMLPSSQYTILYTTSPVSAGSPPSTYDLAHQSEPATASEHLHAELKRDVKSDDDKHDDQPDIVYVDGPLFARYQFLSPGLFMGLLVGFLLLGILGVGVTGLSSLQVSYGAFEKEMGPTAQKKQQ